MRKAGFFLIRALLMVIALCTIFYLIWFPTREGRAVGLDLISIYSDFFIIYSFFTSLPFFLILFQIFELLNCFEKNEIYTLAVIKKVKLIKACSISISAMMIIGGVAIVINNDRDDFAGPLVLGVIILMAFVLIWISASILQNFLFDRYRDQFPKHLYGKKT